MRPVFWDVAYNVIRKNNVNSKNWVNIGQISILGENWNLKTVQCLELVIQALG